jgi:hypothetical protein
MTTFKCQKPFFNVVFMLNMMVWSLKSSSSGFDSTHHWQPRRMQRPSSSSSLKLRHGGMLGPKWEGMSRLHIWSSPRRPSSQGRVIEAVARVCVSTDHNGHIIAVSL